MHQNIATPMRIITTHFINVDIGTKCDYSGAIFHDKKCGIVQKQSQDIKSKLCLVTHLIIRIIREIHAIKLYTFIS